jgi:hypothetical protein
MGLKLRGEVLRGLMGLLVLTVGIRFAVELVAVPRDMFSLAVLAW